MRLLGYELTRSRNLPATQLPQVRLLGRSEEEDGEITEANEIAGRIAAAMKKSMTYDGFTAFDSEGDGGNYFAKEFDIQATAGRIKGTYASEPWIYTASTKISKTLSGIPLKVRNPKTKEPIDNHPVELLLKSGTETKGDFETKWDCYLDLMLGGNYFLVLEADLKSVVDIVPVEHVGLVYGPGFRTITHIDVYSMGGAILSGGMSVRFPMEQVVHVRLPNPFGYLFGMSPFAAASRPLLMDRYKNEYEMAFYLRGATYGGVVETTEDLSKSRFKRMMLSFEQAFTGRANWWRTLFLPKGASWKAASQSMEQMQHLEGLKENRLTILAVLGIPPSQVGIVQDVNRSTSEAQERVYWNETIIPYATFVASGWNNSYLIKQKWKGSIEVYADFSGVEAVEGFVAAKKEKADAMAPYFTIDEIRHEVWGEEPIGDDRGAKLVVELKPVAQGFGSGSGGDPAQLPPAAPGKKDMVSIPEGHNVQCLMFSKTQYTSAEAEAWTKDHGYKANGMTEGSDCWNFPQEPLDAYDAATVKTIVLQDNISAVIGMRRTDEIKRAKFLSSKTLATSSQNRIEAKVGQAFLAKFAAYVDDLVSEASKALLEKRHVREYLDFHATERLEKFMASCRDVYVMAMERGYSIAASQVKDARTLTVEKRAGFPGLNETERQAADIIKERTADGRRRVLFERAIERFKGMDANRTDKVMDVIDQGYREGKGFEEIARTLRTDYGEAYENQSRTIVRTEILSAVSEGLNWNHEVLKEVFTEVLKEWMHQGDEDVNSGARQEHIELDGTTVSGDGKWTITDPKTGEAITLAYPRDPDAPAGQVINCRCTMVSVIPDNAASNADNIVEQGG